MLRIEETDRFARIEVNVGEIIHQCAIDVTVNVAAKQQLHVGRFKTELFHYIKSSKEQFIVVSKRIAVSQQEAIRVVGSDIYPVSTQVEQYKRMRLSALHQCLVGHHSMLASDVDAVSVCTANKFHAKISIQALKSGKHVLCEKPVMMNSKELEDVLAVSKETGKVFYPRQNRRWDKDYRIIKKIYDEKLVGDVFNVECRIMGSRGIPDDWRGIKEFGGGMMMDWGVHIIDRLLAMVPEKVTKVFCSCTYITNKECDDGFKMHLTFESGMTAVLEVGTCHFINLPVWTIYGNYGSACVDNWEYTGKLMRLKDWSDKDTKPILAGAGLTKTMAPRLNNSVDELPLPEVDFDNNELYSNFVDVCFDGAEQIVTGEHALRVLRLMEAALESSEKGQVIFFE